FLLGAGFTTKFAERFTLDVQARQTESDGFADFTAFPGGAPLGTRPAAQDFDNYEDIELTSVLAKLGYQFNPRFSLGFSYLWEDYTIDSFIVQDLQFYLPGALLINGNNYDYDAQVFRLDLGISF
ncbi:MAG TPA: MtrB/PioB family outer membrane beta-barrel protein, partial [Thermoanaerobaculia bacterium]|nr:MtrB/PioB family outer membrane beta-barrel protein [Thermoanaerobaculia bacterium]